MFRGREHAHPEVAERLILRAFDQLKDLGKLETRPKKEGRDMHALVAPLPEATRKKAMGVRKERKENPEKEKEQREAEQKEEEEKASRIRVVREQIESQASEPSKDEENGEDDEENG